MKHNFINSALDRVFPFSVVAPYRCYSALLSSVFQIVSGIAFSPIVSESLGGWHEVAVSQVARLGRCQARQEGDDEEVVVKRLIQKASLLIQKGNSALWNNRVPEDPTDLNLFL